jgi:hypothetical protein
VGSQEPDGKIGPPNFPIIALSCAVFEEINAACGVTAGKELKARGIGSVGGVG